jgi:hypothetical protein
MACPDHIQSIDVCGFRRTNGEILTERLVKERRAADGPFVTWRAPDPVELLHQLPSGSPPPSPELLIPGALVLGSRGWTWTPGASWRHPEGPGKGLESREAHPVGGSGVMGGRSGLRRLGGHAPADGTTGAALFPPIQGAYGNGASSAPSVCERRPEAPSNIRIFGSDVPATQRVLLGRERVHGWPRRRGCRRQGEV